MTVLDGLRAAVALVLTCAGLTALAQDDAARPSSCHGPEVLQLMREHRFAEALALEQERLQQLDTSRDDIFAVSVCTRAQIGGLLSRLERDKEALSILEPLVQEARARIGAYHRETLQAEILLATAYGE
jgi:hypothetical protein